MAAIVKETPSPKGKKYDGTKYPRSIGYKPVHNVRGEFLGLAKSSLGARLVALRSFSKEDRKRMKLMCDDFNVRESTNVWRVW